MSSIATDPVPRTVDNGNGNRNDNGVPRANATVDISSDGVAQDGTHDHGVTMVDRQHHDKNHDHQYQKINNEFGIIILKEYIVKKNGKKRRITIELHRMNACINAGASASNGNTDKGTDTYTNADGVDTNSKNTDTLKYIENAFIRISKRQPLYEKVIKQAGIKWSSPKKSRRNQSRYDDDASSNSMASQLSSVPESRNGSGNENGNGNQMISSPRADMDNGGSIHNDNNNDQDQASIMSLSTLQTTSNYTIGGDGQEWTSRHLLGLEQIHIKQVANKRITLELDTHLGSSASASVSTDNANTSASASANASVKERHFVFHNSSQAKAFSDAIGLQKKEQIKREREQLLSCLKIGNIDIHRELRSLRRNMDVNANMNADMKMDTNINMDMTDDARQQNAVNAFKSQQISFLIEIVGCEHLPIADLKTSDPYVVVKFQGRTIHKTKHCPYDLNPVFMLRQKAFFIWTCSMRDLFLGSHCSRNWDTLLESGSGHGEMDGVLRSSYGGLALTVMDYDAITADSVLGAALIPPHDIYNGNEERKVYTLKTQDKDETDGTIAIRVRRATDYDKEFLATHAAFEKKRMSTAVLFKEGTFNRRGERGMHVIKSMVETKVKTFFVNGSKIEKYKVLPYPDPDHKSANNVDVGHDHILNTEVTSMNNAPRIDPEWMTAAEIEELTLQPSRHYKPVGSGKIAKVHLEILGCNNLPNMEAMRLLGNKSDTFVQVVYEDCICQTPVIDDKTNPRFLPWTDRAFVFHSTFPSSVINLGVFDHDTGIGIQSHDFIGRASINLLNLRVDTEYTLEYKLYDTTLLCSRKDYGTIKVRIRLEIDDPRAYMLASLSIPPTRYINSESHKVFECVHQTCHGKDDMTTYSICNIYEHIDELYNYYQIYYYAKVEIKSLIFWRASHSLTTTKGIDLCLPINSLCAFLMAVTVIENPFLLPSFSFITMAWILVVSMRWRNQHPSPWRSCPSYVQLMKTLMFGKDADLPTDTIACGENSEEGTNYDLTWKELIEKAERKAAERAAEIAQEQIDLNKELTEIGGLDVDIDTKISSKGKVDPTAILLKHHLWPTQQMLLSTCRWARVAKNVLLWEEPLYSFWLTLALVTLSLMFLIVPWKWLICWSLRIITWILFGPWMKLVDWYFLRTDAGEDDSEAADRLSRKKDNDDILLLTRVRNELAFKYRDFKRYFFGKFLTKVPIMNLDRHVDAPLSTSSAQPWQRKDIALSQSAVASDSTERDAGQHLLGLMIPRLKDAAPQLDKKETAKHLDSAKATSIKLGCGICIAAVATYYIVPILIYCAKNGSNIFRFAVQHAKYVEITM